MYLQENGNIDEDKVSALCQFHLVDEHNRHRNLIETILVKVSCDNDDDGPVWPLCKC